MKRGQKFLTILVLIVLLALWYMERPRLQAAWAQVRAARAPGINPAPAARPGAASTSPKVTP